MGFLQRVAKAAACGYILYFYSERVFWSRLTEANVAADVAGGWLTYSLLAYLFLWFVAAFRARRFAALFLCGALFGWLAEGVVVQTMYDHLPWQISFTGLAWHALISVVIGWHLVRRVLLAGRPLPLLGLAAALGLGWGLWALAWPLEWDAPVSRGHFAVHAMASGAALVVAYAAYDRLGGGAFRPVRIEKAVLAGLPAVWYVLVTVPANPLALVVLPPLLAVVLLALARNRRSETREDLPAARAPWWGYAVLLVTPLTAVAVYAVAWRFEWWFPSNVILYLVTTPAGFALLGWSVYRLFWPGPGPASVAGGAQASAASGAADPGAG